MAVLLQGAPARTGFACGPNRQAQRGTRDRFRNADSRRKANGRQDDRRSADCCGRRSDRSRVKNGSYIVRPAWTKAEARDDVLTTSAILSRVSVRKSKEESRPFPCSRRK